MLLASIFGIALIGIIFYAIDRSIVSPVRAKVKVTSTVKFDQYEIQPDGIIEYRQKKLT